MATRTRKVHVPTNRIEVLVDGEVVGRIPLEGYLSARNNEWFGIPNPQTKKPAHSTYGMNVASTLLGLDEGQLPDQVNLVLNDEIIDTVELEEGVTQGGAPKVSSNVTVEVPDLGMRRFTFRCSSLRGARNNITGAVTMTGGGSATIESWD